MSSAVGPRLPQLLLVAGAGRSGTSLVSGLCSRLGFHIPLPEVLADESNPRGFGEPRWAVDFHTRLLKQLNMAPEDGRPEAWDLARTATELPTPRTRLARWLEEQLQQADRVVVKDPRLTWFVGLWASVAQELGAEVSVLTMLRHPAESVTSRRLAYGTGSSATTRTASWLNMTLGLEAENRGMRRAVVAVRRPPDGLAGGARLRRATVGDGPGDRPYRRGRGVRCIARWTRPSAGPRRTGRPSGSPRRSRSWPSASTPAWPAGTRWPWTLPGRTTPPSTAGRPT